MNEKYIDFSVGAYLIWFDRISHSVYVILMLSLFDFIEEVKAEDVTVKIEFTYDDISDPFDFPW